MLIMIAVIIVMVMFFVYRSNSTSKHDNSIDIERHKQEIKLGKEEWLRNQKKVN